MERLTDIYNYLLNLPRWQRWLIILLLGVLVYAFLYYYRVEPLKKELTERNRKVKSLILTVNRLKVLEKRKKSLELEISQLRKQIEEIEMKLPTGKENVAQIIRSITTADSGMIIEKIERKPQKKEKYFIKYPYEVELIGTYPAFVLWCERLSKANRIINFGPMSLKALKEKASSNNKATLLVKLDIEAFTLRE